MDWTNEYPHTIYQQVLLLDGKMIDWKIGGNRKTASTWTRRMCYKEGSVTVETKEIEVNNDQEHNEAFRSMEWFKQFKIMPTYNICFKPY